ncbi:MAG TPA: hypothetical protein VFJ51_02705 [Nitrososphaeraceae archaeon]|nr:hypothetical protein [Nitrososphaeraceae archaeon]
MQLLIRHCVEESNIDQNLSIIDPTKIRHAVLRGGRIESLSGLVDPASHLNLDYPDHKVTVCAIIEKFEIGAKVRIADNGIVFAKVDSTAYDHYGNVDYTERLSNMIQAVKREREVRMMVKRRGEKVNTN